MTGIKLGALMGKACTDAKLWSWWVMPKKKPRRCQEEELIGCLGFCLRDGAHFGGPQPLLKHPAPQFFHLQNGEGRDFMD